MTIVSVSHLPSIQPQNNATQQARRRINQTVDAVTQSSSDLVSVQGQLAPGISGTVTLAKLTTGGNNGSLTFIKGIITAYVQPT